MLASLGSGGDDSGLGGEGQVVSLELLTYVPGMLHTHTHTHTH
jgi:hypothetical protein